jgi:hypothetical protein
MNPDTCYIAGPMTGYHRYNFDAFDEAAKTLRDEGWRVIKESCSDRIGPFLGGYSPTDKKNWVPIPNYHGDLNAMHEAIGGLGAILGDRYLKRLTEVCDRDFDEEYPYLDGPTFTVYINNTTAAQRAEAFLRTIGQWEDEK